MDIEICISKSLKKYIKLKKIEKETSGHPTTRFPNINKNFNK